MEIVKFCIEGLSKEDLALCYTLAKKGVNYFLFTRRQTEAKPTILQAASFYPESLLIDNFIPITIVPIETTEKFAQVFETDPSQTLYRISYGFNSKDSLVLPSPN